MVCSRVDLFASLIDDISTIVAQRDDDILKVQLNNLYHLQTSLLCILICHHKM